MRLLNVFLAGAAVLAPLAAGPVRAQEKEERRLPEFTLKTAGGDPLSARYEGGALTVTRKGEPVKAKVALIHFFQPDCNACLVEMKALEGLHKELGSKGALVAGVAHRGDEAAVKGVAEKLKLTFPLLLGQGSDLAKALSRGDATVIADGKGGVRFSQVGFKEGDEKTFRETVENLLADKAVTAETDERRRLAVGEKFPEIKLPSLMTGKPISMSVEDGKLTVRDESGKAAHPKAAVGFFSRYWDFSVEEMGHLQKFHEKYAKDGLQVFAIAMQDEIEEARKTTREKGWNYPVFNGVGSALGDKFAYGWPAYVIDAGGVIRYTQVGFEEGDEKKYEKVFSELLKK